MELIDTKLIKKVDWEYYRVFICCEVKAGFKGYPDILTSIRYLHYDGTK